MSTNLQLLSTLEGFPSLRLQRNGVRVTWQGTPDLRARKHGASLKTSRERDLRPGWSLLIPPDEQKSTVLPLAWARHLLDSYYFGWAMRAHPTQKATETIQITMQPPKQRQGLPLTSWKASASSLHPVPGWFQTGHLAADQKEHHVKPANSHRTSTL